MQTKTDGIPSTSRNRISAMFERVIIWLVASLALTATAASRLWKPRHAGPQTAPNPTGKTRREEKRRRKELWRATKASGRQRRAA